MKIIPFELLNRTYYGFRDYDKVGWVTYRIEGGADTAFRLFPEPSQEVYNHSPDGFEWGYNGSGPSQLALGLLLEHCDEKTSLRLYQDFREDVVSKLEYDLWEMHEDRIKNGRKIIKIECC